MNDLIQENAFTFDLPSLDLTRFSEPQAGKAAGEKHLVFLLGEKFYAVASATVAEVSPALPVTVLPNAPEWLLGIANLRGEIISVVNLPRLLNINVSTLAPKSKFIILSSSVSEGGLAFTADKISEIIALPKEEIQPVADETLPQVFGKAVYKSHTLNLINTEKLLPALTVN